MLTCGNGVLPDYYENIWSKDGLKDKDHRADKRRIVGGRYNEENRDLIIVHV